MSDERHPTLRALALRDVRAYLAARFCAVLARTLLKATLVWHVFDLTRQELWLGALGLVEFLPVLPMAIVGGAVADARDRRNVVWLAQAGSAVCAVALCLAAGAQATTLPLLLGAAFAVRVVWGLEFPSGQALLPTLVPRDLFQSAVVLSATVRNLSAALGPVLAGLAIASGGVERAYALAAGLHALGLIALLGVRRPGAAARDTRIGTRALREGLAFLRARPALLAAMGLDMVAVILADPTVLLAVFADEILAVGPRGYGLLSGAMAAGTTAMTLGLLFRPSFARPGRALLLAVGAFGAAAVAFGASRTFALSVAALLAAGMADQVSQVARSVLLQLSTPDALRGRVSAVNMVFVSASNELGAAFSGFLAAGVGAVAATVGGGAACVLMTAGLAARAPTLRRARIEELRPWNETAPEG